MKKSKMLQAMNAHIAHEFYSAYLYLSMSAYFESINLPGSASWMRMQYQEEVEHGMKFFDFIHDVGGQVELQAIAKPSSKCKSPLDAFEQALAHEKKVTSMIHGVYDLAVKEKDYAAQIFLQWFVTEQVEEEKTASDVIEQLKMVGDFKPSLLELDRHLAKRNAE
jgi:ferritin